eukprot:gene4874-9718_t
MEPDNSVKDINDNFIQCKCKIGYVKKDRDCSLDMSGSCKSFSCVKCSNSRNSTSYSDNSACTSCGYTTLGLANSTKSAYYGDCLCPTSTSTYALIENDLTGRKSASKTCQPCPSGSIVILKNSFISGKLYTSNLYECQKCPDKNMYFTYDSRGYICDCSVGYTKVGQSIVGEQSCINSLKSSQFLNSENLAATINFNAVNSISIYILHYYTKTATNCLYYGGSQNIQDCQILLHLCILQLYNSDSLPCATFLNIVRSRGYTTTTGMSSIPSWGQGLPWLFYTSTSNPCLDTSIQMKMSLKSKKLNYIVSKYSLDGLWLGYENVSTLFSYCSDVAPYTSSGGGSSSTSKWQIFGTTEKNEYSYDETNKMYPIPIKIINLKSGGKSPNSYSTKNLCTDGEVYVRRFFLYDIISGITITSTSSQTSTSSIPVIPIPNIIRYASKILITTQIREDDPTRIYAPIIIYQQCNSDIFFIDWEPSKSTSNTTSTSSQVSIWRTILAANEWSELQTTRRANIQFTLFWIGFFLLGLKLEFNATSQPNLNDLSQPSSTSSSTSLNPILRFANTTWWWFLMVTIQVLWKVLIYERWITEPAQ